MFYKKKEEYDFSVPKEYKAYLAFRDRLRESGIPFLEEDGRSIATISIITRGNFEVDDKCDILDMVRE